jgi:hypothetical protein
MRLAHLLNALTLATKRVAHQVRAQGVQAFLRFVRESCAHRWLRAEKRRGGILRGVTGLGLPLFYQLPPEPLVPACRNGHSEQIPPSLSSSPP